MDQFKGKTAFVTGGASGIGLGLCRAFGRRGMNVAIADVEAAACVQAVEALRSEGIAVIGVTCDVSDRESLAAAAAQTFSTFGNVHILCNNAGVSRAGPIEAIAPSDWNWVIGVNLKGLVHGLQIFVPHMKAHGEEGHIVNTASMNGVAGTPLAGPYCATKFAAVGISEVLAAELAGSPIGVSVLCPSWVKTRMLDNGRNRPAHFGGPISLDTDGGNAERNRRYASALANGLDPACVAELVCEAIEARRLYVFTHADRRIDVERRFELMMDGFDALSVKTVEFWENFRTIAAGSGSVGTIVMEFSGKTAFVTGAANGIGLGICRALARNGVNIVLADIERARLEIAQHELATFNVRTHAIEVDVSDAAAFERAADEAEAEFGNIHFLFNNAGVSLGVMPLWEVTPAQWEWIFGVNVQGVINGIRTLVPRMRKHGEAGHVVNTASIGGLQVNPKLRNGSYAMTKYAIVALSEALALDLEGSAIGASLLCPALVATTLHASSRRRPARLGGPYDRPGADAAKAWQSAGLSPDDVGMRVLDAVAACEFFIFTHEEPRAWIEQRHARILAGFDSIARYNARERLT